MYYAWYVYSTSMYLLHISPKNNHRSLPVPTSRMEHIHSGLLLPGAETKMFLEGLGTSTDNLAKTGTAVWVYHTIARRARIHEKRP